MKLSQAKRITGGLSRPSKMPCFGYSIPAKRCHMGSKLAKINGSTCSGCYALKGNYRFSNVQMALEKRFKALNHPKWIEGMADLILATKNPFFRWHDSGDLQSVEHLEKIAEVCRRTPEVKHWLPTREYKVVADYRKTREIPPNLVIRLSAHMVDAAAPSGYGLPTSTVHSTDPSSPFTILNQIPQTSHLCPARSQGNQCKKCRACWDSNVQNVSYHIH